MRDTMVVDVSQDWASACDVQQGFMHGGAPQTERIGCSARCQQLRALGGDCYDFLPIRHNQLAFAIGDASGKSLPAALMIVNVQSSLRTAALFAGDKPATVLGAVNRQVHSASLADRFATLFYGVLDADTRLLRYANAGHNPPMVIRQNGDVAQLDAGGLPLGLFTHSAYDEGTFQLFPGDTVIAYTDGVTEAVNLAGEEWGVEGIRKAAVESKAESAEELVEAVFASLEEYCKGRRMDDATTVVIRVD
jgi:phosphoserine phosphatase RsbU/P